jgi:NifU-like protein involved in Fe-S cluster formation
MLSAIAAEHVQRPRNCGELANPTHVGMAGERGEGPYVILRLIVGDGRILKAAYQTNGCPSSIASASVLCQLITGREVERVLRLDDKDLLAVLGGLPEGKSDCAERAVDALRNALVNEEMKIDA